MLDDDTRARIRELGGIRAIAITHPHFYSRMADWAQEFDAPVYVHEADRRWVMQPSERVQYWTGACCQLLNSLLHGASAMAFARGCRLLKCPREGPARAQAANTLVRGLHCSV